MRLRYAIAALALAGAAIAGYLVYTRYSGARIACATGGCEAVQHSRYSKLAGVPVPLLGLAGFLLLAASALFRRPAVLVAAAALAFAGGLFALYLLLVQFFVLHAVCQWCVASDVISLSLAGAAGGRLILDGVTPSAPWQPRSSSIG